MAVRFDNVLDYLSDGTHPVSTGSAFTVCYWAKIASGTSGYWSACWALNDNELGYGVYNGGDFFAWWEVGGGGGAWYLDPSGYGIISADGLGVWVFHALVWNSSSSRSYYLWTPTGGWMGSSDTSTTRGIGTPATEYWARYGSSGDTLNGSLAFFKSWTTALAEADLQEERTKPYPVHTTNLHRFLRLREASSAGTDTSSTYSSGHTYNATVNGTLADDTDPSYVDAETTSLDLSVGTIFNRVPF